MVSWMPRSTRSSAALRAVPLQKFDLHMVQRIEIRKAVADRALEQRVALQQRSCPMIVKQRVDRVVPLPCESGPKICLPQRRVRRPVRRSVRRWRCCSSPAPCPCSTAASGRTAIPDTWPAGTAMPVVRMLREPGLHRGAEAVPARQHQPALRPAEHPGNRAQILDARASSCATPAGCRCSALAISVMTVDAQK